MNKILVSGSIAYDYIMDYDNKFEGAITKDSSGRTGASMTISDMKKETGGTGLNIAFNLAMLGEDAILLGAIGDDFIFDDFIKEKINLTYIHRSNRLLSASAYIINDSFGGQITSFYPGAMQEAGKVSVSDIKEEISYFMVSPNRKEAMLKHLGEGKKYGLKTFFDPGQMLASFSKEELIEGSENSTYLIVNEVEFEDFKSIIGLGDLELLNYFEKIIVTLGEKGSKIIDKSGVTCIGSVKTNDIVDPTGGGDAFRAGLMKGLKHGFDFETSSKIGSITASYCIQFNGGQNHFVNKGLIIEGMKESYSLDIEL